MRVTVLGCGAAYPRPGGACSGFLVTSGDTNVWIDAGNGTFSNLQLHLSHREIDALVVTHAHGDHISDILPLMYALGFDTVADTVTVPLYAPPEVAQIVSWPLGDTSLAIFKRVFEPRSIAEPFEVGPLRFEPFRTNHPAETYGLRVTDGERALVYTSDTALFPELVDRCRDADLLVIEATYVEGADAPPNVHLWAREAGKVAADAGTKRVVLTHVWPTFDPEQAVREAAETYDGPLEAAVEGKVYDV